MASRDIPWQTSPKGKCIVFSDFSFYQCDLGSLYKIQTPGASGWLSGLSICLWLES